MTTPSILTITSPASNPAFSAGPPSKTRLTVSGPFRSPPGICLIAIPTPLNPPSTRFVKSASSVGFKTSVNLPVTRQLPVHRLKFPNQVPLPSSSAAVTSPEAPSLVGFPTESMQIHSLLDNRKNYFVRLPGGRTNIIAAANCKSRLVPNMVPGVACTI